MPFIGPSGKALMSATTSAQVLTALGLTLPGTAITQTFSTTDATHAARAASAITDNSGGAAADGTIGAVTAPTALTVADGTGTNDGTIGAITADASVIAAVQELAAGVNAARTAIVALTDAVKELSTGVNNVRTDAVDTASLLNSVVDALQAAGILS